MSSGGGALEVPGGRPGELRHFAGRGGTKGVKAVKPVLPGAEVTAFASFTGFGCPGHAKCRTVVGREGRALRAPAEVYILKEALNGS